MSTSGENAIMDIQTDFKIREVACRSVESESFLDKINQHIVINKNVGNQFCTNHKHHIAKAMENCWVTTDLTEAVTALSNIFKDVAKRQNIDFAHTMRRLDHTAHAPNHASATHALDSIASHSHLIDQTDSPTSTLTSHLYGRLKNHVDRSHICISQSIARIPVIWNTPHVVCPLSRPSHLTLLQNTY